MAQYQDTTGKYFNTQAQAAASNTALGTNPSVSNINVGSIPVDNLNTPVKPLSLTTPQVPTYGGLEGTINGIVTQSKTQAEQDLVASKDKTDSSMEAYFKELAGSGNISSSVDRTAQDAAKKQSDLYTSQLEQEQLSNRRQIENLQKNNPQGLFGGALEQEINRLNRDSLSKQADIAILQTAANRNYSTAAEIADRQVAMKLEQSQSKLAALKFFYEQNKDDFNKADERLYSEVVKKADREYEKQKSIENEIKNIKLMAVQNGADLATINRLSQATTIDEALRAAGKYATDPLERALKIAQINSANRANRPSSGENLNELLSITEAKEAGVPYGTTKAQLIASGGQAVSPLVEERAADKIAKLSNLAENKVGLRSSSGSYRAPSIGQQQKTNDWRADAVNVLAGLTVDELGRVKLDGVTFGALSDPERKAVGDSASALNAGMIFKDGIPTGRFKLSENKVKKEIETILKYSKIDYERKTGKTYEDNYVDQVDSALQEVNSPYAQYLN